MMKKSLSLFFYYSILNLTAQVPSGYYTSATGTEFTLKSQLHAIIDGHTDNGYSALWDFYEVADVRSDGFVWDIYSDCDLAFDEDQDNGTGGTVECDKFNREHTFPQSWFSSQSPMRNDAHMVLPTDKKVNSERGNLPYSEVSSVNYTSLNGSTTGTSEITIDGYTGQVFEPIDEFKGDIARIFFYMATRYEDLIDDWDQNSIEADAVLNGTSDQVYEDWVIDLMGSWHVLDPVSQKEIDRNDEVYTFQGNRNPFIDHPEWVSEIWNTTTSSIEVSATNTLDFGTVSFGEHSTSQSYSVSGSNLSSDITVTVDAPFELSLDNTTWSQSVIAPQANSSTTVYVRFSPTLENGTLYSQTILHTATDASDVEITVTGQEGEASSGIGIANDLFFSEYIEGSGNNKALEIFNGTGVDVDLSQYEVRLYANGSSSTTSTLSLSGTLTNNDVFVIGNSSADIEIQNEADVESDVTFFNGDDAISLVKNGTTIDVIGVIGTDPGSAWVYGDHSTSEKTLVRKSSINTGNANGFDPLSTLSTEWDVFDQNTTSHIGSHVFTSIVSIVWDGSESSDWDNANNWENNIVPTVTDNVTIPNVGFDPVVMGDFGVNNLEIEDGVMLTIASGAALAVYGDATGYGEVSITKQTTGNSGYSILGSPITSQDIFYLYPDYAYDFEDSFLPATGNMIPGKGYFIGYDAPDPEVEFIGKLNSGSISYTIEAGYQLVSNPYAAAISISDFQDENDGIIDGTIYFWNDGGENNNSERAGSYVTVNNLGIVSNVDLGGTGQQSTGSASNGTISSVQGFFVYADNAGDIQFTPTMQSTSSDDNSDAKHYRISQPSTLKVSLTNEEYRAETLIGFAETATNGKDFGMDALYLENKGEAIKLYTVQNENQFAIQALPYDAEEPIQLEMEVTEEGEYELGIEVFLKTEGSLALLRDLKTDEVYAIDGDFSLKVIVEKIDVNRFEIQYFNSEPLGFANDLDSQALSFKLLDNFLEVTNETNEDQYFSLISLSGQVIFSSVLNERGEKAFISIPEKNQIYILRNAEKSFKFIVN